jgi:multidrug efflux pump subunit AcrA (membrane-fusion protein)
METYSLPCAGRISLSVKSAQSVKKGDVLYTVVAPEVGAQEAELKTAQAALQRCNAELATLKTRLEKLRAIGTANSDLESEYKFKNAEQAQLVQGVSVAESRLRMLVMDAELQHQNGMTSLVVRAKGDGTVRNVGITQGSWGEQGTPVVTMSNLASMEVVGTLYGNDVPDFSTIRATRLSGRNQQELTGTWRMAEQVDEERQTRAFYFTPDALPADARPGQLCRVDFYTQGGEKGYVNIPDSALVKVGIDDVVFLEVKEGTFAKVKVQAGTSRRGMTPVKGLVPGQRLVVKGGYELRYLLPADGSQQKKAGHFHADGKFHEGEDH